MFLKGFGEENIKKVLRGPIKITFNNVTAGDVDKVFNHILGDTGWHTDGNKIGAYIQYEFGDILPITEARLYYMDKTNPTTNAVYRVDGSHDGVNWESASKWFNPKEPVSIVEWESIGGRKFWRLVVVASATEGSLDTSGSWFGELEFYEKQILLSAPTVSVSTPIEPSASYIPELQVKSIMNMKVGGIPVVYAGGGLLGLILLLKIFRK